MKMGKGGENQLKVGGKEKMPNCPWFGVEDEGN
jgi:hypothetical protein